MVVLGWSEIISGSPDRIWPYEATPFSNRKVFALVSAILMPVCWLGSFIFLRLYLKKDNREMVFKHEKKEVGNKRFLIITIAVGF